MKYEDICDKEECRKYLSESLRNFSSDETRLLLEFTRIAKYKKQTIIPNRFVDKNICIVSNGVVGHFTSSEKLEELVLRFTFVGELLCFYGNSNEQLQAISNCVICFIPQKILDQIANGGKKLNECINQLTLKKLDFEVNLLRAIPEERYKLILKRERCIFMNVPVKFIASYLGITPQALCRIRKRLLLNEHKR